MLIKAISTNSPRKNSSNTKRLVDFALLVSFVIFLCANSNANAEEPLDFNRDVRPILSDNCILCHGPAESTREADLRLDDREAAIDFGAIVPGEPENSEMVTRIFSDEADEIMPPPDSNKHLTESQREILKRWIAEGAEYQQHWSFVAPEKSTDVKESNPVDFFIEQKLKTVGLELSKEADLRTLIRRVTLDLNGVPPTLDDVNAFVTDAKARGVDAAYEKVVDRLLASSAYGERMALAWMDAARYGDTSVMHADGPRDMWPWRDWVINAYNSNMPFDQFTIEQIAGDLIPDATLDQKIASGFNRNHATSDEGGAFAEELRVEYVVDRVQTTSTVWMALTMECSQCHDHKYDPISQEEYYQFFAYFNNTTDPGMQTRNGNQTPVVEVVSKDREAKLAELDASIKATKNALAKYRTDAEPKFAAWAKKQSEEAGKSGKKSSELSGLAHWFPLDEAANEAANKQLANKTTGAFATLQRGKFESVDRHGNKALKLNGATEFVCNTDAPELKNTEPFTFAAWIKSNGSSGGAVFSRMNVAKSHRGYDFWIQGRNIGTHIINTWPGNAVKVVSKDQLEPNKWQHVVVTYDGSQKAKGVQIYIDGKLSGNTVEADTLTATIETDAPFKIGSRSTGGNWKGEVDDIRIYQRALSAEEVSLAKVDPINGILATAADKRSKDQIRILREFYFANEFSKSDKQYQKLQKDVANANKKLADLNGKPTTTMTMQDNPANKMRMTFILDRGQYDAPKKDAPVTPGVPAALPPLPEDAPANRLGLANWLTSPENPLTARVAVNRYWMLLFGNGMVRTAGDFGAQGTTPTHPKLLDWLAVDFVDSDWDVKRMLKTMVMSKTYRQTSRREKFHFEKDPENLLIGHSPRFRLQGELIRDQALAVSGLLVDQVGGAGVKPYQPPNIWNEVSLNGGLRYKQDNGEKLYRKSMYTYWKRSAPMPNMIIFDTPSREKCVVQRARTNTPLQALVTLNDPQFVEAARNLAQRLLASKKDDESRIDYAYQLCVSRSATKDEQAIINRLLADQRKRFGEAPEKAKELLSIGESKRDESIDAIEHAAWTVIAQMILNLDETLTRN